MEKNQLIKKKIIHKMKRTALREDDYKMLLHYLKEATRIEKKAQRVRKGFRVYLIDQEREMLYIAEKILQKYEL